MQILQVEHRCVISFTQDACFKKVSMLTSSAHQSSEVNKIVKNGFQFIKDNLHAPDPRFMLSYIKSVAEVKFGLSFVAEQLINNQPDRSLLEVIVNLCVDPKVNERKSTSPAFYLVKLIVRQYGLACLYDVGKVYAWIIPERFKRVEKVS